MARPDQHVGFTPLLLTLLASLMTPPSLASTTSFFTQCPNAPPGPLAKNPITVCPLPGLIGVIPELESTTVQWTYPPRCLGPESLKPNGTRHDCLFTSAEFRNGHGISIIGPASITADLIAQGAFIDRPDPPAAVKRQAGKSAYRVVDVPGKGKGVVAARKIKRGEIVMADYPSVLISTGFVVETKPHHRRRLLKAAFNQLPEETKEAVYGLKRGAEKHLVDQIVGTNSNGIELGVEEGFVGVFVKVARINHSCKPNAYYRFSQERLVMEVVSFRAIEEGEEITMSYVPLDMKHDERRHFLEANWGIECGCSLCRANDYDIGESENKRRLMKEWKDTLQAAKRDKFYKDAITIAQDILQVSEQADLPPLLPEYHDILADLYSLKGDLPEALRYARMALNEWVRFGSLDYSELEWAREALEEIVEKDAARTRQLLGI